MESDFIEISGEDDSLLPLPKIPNDDVSFLNFSCSPLHLLGSDRPIKPPLPSRTPAADETREKLDSLLGRDGVNKENVSVGKPELPKLNMEPQQMKRKKKGGGYNLRKSLAWDRAFLTEEGVLDPLELSMISGNIGKSSGGMLSVIDEDRGESLSGDSGNLVALEDNLFKELPASTANEDRKSSEVVLPKNGPSAGVNVASPSAAKRKVLSANDTNRTGSKRSGCPRPVPSSSLKRPANLKTSKAATKELKVSKVPVPKPDAYVIPSTANSTVPGASSSKQNQTSQRAVNAQRNIGQKASLNNSKSAQNNAKSGLASKSIAAKSSVKPAKRNVVSSVSKIHSSTNSQHPLDTKANNGSKNYPAPASQLPASGLASNNGGSSRKFENSVPQNIPRSAGCSHAQPQKPKPSGLRMPSPSMSFFNQSKASASTSLLQTSNQACNVQSNIPNLRKVGALNTNNDKHISAPGMIADVVNNMALRPPHSITGSSFPSNVKLDSHEKLSSNLHNDAIQKVCMNLTSNCNSFDVLNQRKLHNPCNDFEQHAEQSKNEKICHVGDNELKSNDNKLLLQTALSDQVMEDADNERVANVYPMSTDLTGAELENPDCTSQLCPTAQVDVASETRDMINNKCIEGKICDSSIKNYGVFLESLYAKSCVPDVNEQSKEQADNKKLYTCQDGQISNKSQSLWINNDTWSIESGSLSEFQKCNSMLIADASLEVKCHSVNELESSHALFQSKNLEEAKDSVAGVDIFSTKSQMGDKAAQSVSGILSAGEVNNLLSSPALDNQHITVADDASQVIIDAGGSNSNCYSVPSSISPATEDCRFDVAKTAKCLHGDDALLGSADAQLSCDIKLCGQTTSGDLEVMNDHQIAAAVTTGDIQLSNVPDIGDFSGCELENLQHLTSQHSTMVQPEVNDAAKTAERLHGDDALPGPIDAEFSHDIKLHGQTTSGESEMMNEDQITATVTSGDIQLLNVPDSGDFRGCELENLQHLISQHSATVQPEVNDAAKTAECLHGNDALPDPIDSEFSHDIKLHGQTTSGESEMMNDDQITATVITGDIQLLNVPDGGYFRGCELENFQHLTSQHSTMEQLEVNDVIAAVQVNGGSDIIEHKDMEEKTYNISENNQCSNSYLQPDTAYYQQSTLIVHNDGLTSRHIVAESPDVRNSSGRGSENSHVCFHHEHTEKTNEEIAWVDDTIKKSHMEDAQMEAVDENLSVDSCNCNLSAVKNMSSECVNGVREQSGVHTDPDPLSVLGSPDSHAFSLNENLIINNFSSEDLQESNVCGCAMDDESSSNVLTHVTPSLKNDVLEERELESPFDEALDSFDIQTSVENPNNYTTPKFKPASLERSNDQKVVVKSCNSEEDQTLSSVQIIDVNMLKNDVLSEELKSSNGSLNSKIQLDLEGHLCATEDKGGSVIQNMKFNEYKSGVVPEEAKTTTFQKIGGPNSDMKHELEDSICARDDNDETKLTKNLWSDKKKNDIVIKPPPHAVPFSDEWLAALEAAGEEILTKKSGAVQNSPPEKSLPEPGPWSPVKRKNNQEIGPFDCTKYTNTNFDIPPSDSN